MPNYRLNRSSLWDHFDKQEKKALCKHCNTCISISNGSLSNLARHIKSKHPSSRIYEKSKKINISPTSELKYNLAYQEIISGSKNVGSRIVKKSHPTREPVYAPKSRSLDMQLMKMIVKEYHPLSLVDGNEFRIFVKMLCGEYSLPSKKTVSNDLIPQIYNSTLEQVKKQLKDVEAVCLTIDSWTSVSNESFTAVTAHFLTSNLELSSVLLECTSFTEGHTAENISLFLEESLSKFHIQNKVVACVIADDAVNELAAIQMCNWQHLPCFLHTINLIVQEGLREIAETTSKVKIIVEYFKSPHALSKLKATQEEMSLPQLKLKQDIGHMWNSTYVMLERFLQFKEPIGLVLDVLNAELATLLTLEDWIIIEKSVNILKIFLDVTNDISGEKSITVSKLIPLLKLLRRRIYNLSEVFLNEISDMINIFKQQIDIHFESIEDNELIAQATILDPRFKKYSFFDEIKYKVALETLKGSVGLITLNKDSDNGSLSATVKLSKSTPIRTSNNSLWDDFDKEIESLEATLNPPAAGVIELEKYLNESLLHRTADPLTWWKEREVIYPHLIILVKKRLCITAMSAPWESLCTKTGQELMERRNGLRPTKINEIIFLNHNL